MSQFRNLSSESKMLWGLKEYFASGLFEDAKAPMLKRMARAVKRHLENSDVSEYSQSPLYPCGNADIWRASENLIAFNYSFSISFNQDSFNDLCEKESNEDFQNILLNIKDELKSIAANPLSSKFAIGGAGYTHSIIDYERILEDGLLRYRERIAQKLGATDSVDAESFYSPLLEVMDAIIAYHGRCLEHLRQVYANQPSPDLGKLIKALEHAPLKPASNFYEAILSVNFMFYLDGADSIGRFDIYMRRFYDSGKEAPRLLKAFWENMDARNGWHMILGGTDPKGSSYSDFTALCLTTMKGMRRPNCGVKVNKNMADEIWDAAFDALESGCGNPAFYNEELYLENIPEHTGVSGDDIYSFAFGGCTELMFNGRSNVGSIDGGVNILSVLEESIRVHLKEAAGYEEFASYFKNDLCSNINAALDEINLNQQHKAVHKPQIIRTLFVEDCIDRGAEFNSGGARYNGSVVNFAGLANVVNSLFTIKKFFEGVLNISGDEFLNMLENNFSEHEKELLIIRRFEKFGNNSKEINLMAQELSTLIFSEVLKRKCWRGNGFFLPSCIMFVTYAALGANIGATPDGRLASSPIADSVGPMQGTDRDGPTSMLSSTAFLPQSKGIGTLVLNLRLDKKLFKSPGTRKKVKELILSYFNLGGMQLQINVIDSDALRKAIDSPEKYDNLIVRIGGYSEYFNRLSDDLKKEVLQRTEHSI